MMQLDRFLQSLRRHGLLHTALRHTMRSINRFVTLEMCRVESRTEDPYPQLQARGYETRRIGCEEFRQNLCPELKGVDYQWAFDRGDLCTASICNGQVVAYNFTTTHPTRVRDGIFFSFPSGFVYSFASVTARSHRGNQLARECWQVARDVRRRITGSDPPCIWYIAIDNLESRKASAAFPNHVFRGYTGYVRLLNRWFCFRSPGCRRLGVGFRHVRQL